MNNGDISILLPSRGRPDQFKRMWQSALENAHNPDQIEFVIYRDTDDLSFYEYPPLFNVVLGDRIVLSQMWNECYKVARNSLLMHCGDDIIFKTKGWDSMVLDAFASVPDKILFVHGEDGHWDTRFGTHGIIHRKWAEIVGYFVPPYFSSDFNDTWLNDVANGLGRRLYLPFETEHMHPIFGKAELDQTHQDRIERGQRDGVGRMYTEKQSEREQDIANLRNFINNFQKA